MLELPRARRHLVRLEQQARAAARGAVGHKRLEPLQHEEELPEAQRPRAVAQYCSGKRRTAWAQAGGDAAEQRPGVVVCSSSAWPHRTTGGGAGLLGSAQPAENQGSARERAATPA